MGWRSLPVAAGPRLLLLLVLLQLLLAALGKVQAFFPAGCPLPGGNSRLQHNCPRRVVVTAMTSLELWADLRAASSSSPCPEGATAVLIRYVVG